MPTISGGKEFFSHSESSKKRVFSFEEAYSLMNGRAYLPSEAFGEVDEHMPLVTSEQELIKRRNEGYDLVYFLPLTIEEQYEQFLKRHKRKLLHFDLKVVRSGFDEFDKTREKPQKGWGFIMPFAPHTNKADYLTQIMCLVSDIHKEKNYYPELNNAVDDLLTQYSTLNTNLESNQSEFLKGLACTGIEEEIVPSMAELLFHSAVVLAQSGKKTLLGDLTRTRSRSSFGSAWMVGAQEEGSGVSSIKPKERWGWIASIRRL